MWEVFVMLRGRVVGLLQAHYISLNQQPLQLSIVLGESGIQGAVDLSREIFHRLFRLCYLKRVQVLFHCSPLA